MNGIPKIFKYIRKSELITHLYVTPKAGSVENGFGMEFELPPYAVFWDDSGEPLGDWEPVLRDIAEMVDDGVLFDILSFEQSGIGDGLAEELNKRDGYELAWTKKDGWVPGKENQFNINFSHQGERE